MTITYEYTDVDDIKIIGSDEPNISVNDVDLPAVTTSLPMVEDLAVL